MTDLSQFRLTSPLLSELRGLSSETRLWGEDFIRDIAFYRAGKLDWHALPSTVLLIGPECNGTALYAAALAATSGIQLQVCDARDLAATSVAAFTKAAIKESPPLASLEPYICYVRDTEILLPLVTGGSVAALATKLVVHSRGPKVPIVLMAAVNVQADSASISTGHGHHVLNFVRVGDHQLSDHVTGSVTDAERASLASGPAPLYRGVRASMLAQCSGLSPGDVYRYVNRARRIARRQGREFTWADWVEAIDPPAERPSPEAQLRSAVHEAAHALVAARVASLGTFTASLVPHAGLCKALDDAHLPAHASTAAVLDRLSILLAGRAAEDVVFKDVSALATDDLATANRIARRALGTLGLSPRDPLVVLDETAFAADPERMAELRAILDDSYEFARKTIEADLGYLAVIAEALVALRAITSADLSTLRLVQDAERIIAPAEVIARVHAAVLRSLVPGADGSPMVEANTTTQPAIALAPPPSVQKADAASGDGSRIRSIFEKFRRPLSA